MTDKSSPDSARATPARKPDKIQKTAIRNLFAAALVGGTLMRGDIADKTIATNLNTQPATTNSRNEVIANSSVNSPQHSDQVRESDEQRDFNVLLTAFHELTISEYGYVRDSFARNNPGLDNLFQRLVSASPNMGSVNQRDIIEEERARQRHPHDTNVESREHHSYLRKKKVRDLIYEYAFTYLLNPEQREEFNTMVNKLVPEILDKSFSEERPFPRVATDLAIEFTKASNSRNHREDSPEAFEMWDLLHWFITMRNCIASNLRINAHLSTKRNAENRYAELYSAIREWGGPMVAPYYQDITAENIRIRIRGDEVYLVLIGQTEFWQHPERFESDFLPIIDMFRQYESLRRNQPNTTGSKNSKQ